MHNQDQPPAEWHPQQILDDPHESPADIARGRFTHYESTDAGRWVAEVSLDSDTAEWRWKFAACKGESAHGTADTVEHAKAKALQAGAEYEKIEPISTE